jgi:hypothetical protein
LQGPGRTVRRLIPYLPLPSQRRFHDATERFKGFSGPVGSGKSAALCQEAIKMTYWNPGRKGLLGAPSYKMLRDATVAALVEALEESRLPFSLHRWENRLVMNDTGSEILLRSLSDADRLRGLNLAWFGVDELTYATEAAWNQLEARLRDPNASVRQGFAVWTPNGHDWVWRKFLKGEKKGYRMVRAKPFENRYLLEASPDYYERLKHSYDERTYQQEVLGEYLAASDGMVYYAFSRRANVRAAELREDLPLLWSVDFNVDPMSSVVAQRDGDDLFVLREVSLRRSGTKQMCDQVLQAYGRHRAGIVVYGDASGANRKTTGESDWAMVRQELAKGFGGRVSYRIPKRNPAVRDRISLVNARMRNAAGEEHLFVHPECKELIADFEQVEYRGNTSAVNKEKDTDRTHLSDALGYLVWQEYGARDTAGERGERIL